MQTRTEPAVSRPAWVWGLEDFLNTEDLSNLLFILFLIPHLQVVLMYAYSFRHYASKFISGFSSMFICSMYKRETFRNDFDAINIFQKFWNNQRLLKVYLPKALEFYLEIHYFLHINPKFLFVISSKILRVGFPESVLHQSLLPLGVFLIT